MNSDLGTIVKAGIICDQLGIDTISAGNIVAFAMECYEKGILTKKETEGLELKWGNPEAIVKLVEKMGMKEGIGKTISEGVRSIQRSLVRDRKNSRCMLRVLKHRCTNQRVTKV